MKIFGIILMVAGVIWAVVAFNMNTAVTSPSEHFGSGAFAIDTPSVTVNNLGLMDRRRNNLMFSGFTILVGAVFVGFGSISRKDDGEAEGLIACPYCAELVKPEAKVCKHCGKDIAGAIAVDRQKVADQQPTAAVQGNHQQLATLCASLRDGPLNFDQYQQLAQATGASLGMLTGLWSTQYVVTNGETKVTFNRFKELRPWFLQNVVGKLEQDA